MAEFCLECWNKLNKTKYTQDDYVLSDYLDLCEGCGKYKSVIIKERKTGILHKLRYIILPFRIIYYIIYFVLRLLIQPYLIYREKSTKNK